MPYIDQIIADALAGSPETHVAMLAREVVRLREAAAVVVPDDDRPSREFLENYVEGFDPGERSDALFGWREGRRHLREHSRAIPADRVPGEGMRQVDARRFARMQFEEAERPYLLELERYVRTMAKLQNWSKDAMDYGPLKNLDTLRANQGGRDGSSS